MKYDDDELGGELSQLFILLHEAIQTKDKDGAKNVYGMILWYLANKQNPSLVASLEDMMKGI